MKHSAPINRRRTVGNHGISRNFEAEAAAAQWWRPTQHEAEASARLGEVTPAWAACP